MTETPPSSNEAHKASEPDRIPSISDILCRATKGITPAGWMYRSADPLSPAKIKEANDIIKGVNNSEDGFINGLQGLGNVLSAAANAGEVGLIDVAYIGWLICTIGDTLDGLQFARNEAQYWLDESALRSSQLKANETPGEAS